MVNKDSVLGYFSNLWRAVSGRQASDGTWVYSVDSGNVWKKFKYLEAFCTLPEVNSVITTKANMFSNGKLTVVNGRGKEMVDHKLQPLLKNPNWFQAQKEFMMQTKTFHEIFGNEYLYLFFPIGMPASYASTMYTLDSEFVCAEYTENKPYYSFAQRPSGIVYKVTDGVNESNLLSDAIIHFNDNRVHMRSMSDKNILMGESKLEALAPVLNNLKLAYESRGVILKNRGALGILSNAGADVAGTTSVLPDEQERIENAFKKNYGGLEKQVQILITSANLKWQQMGVNPDKLGLFQESKEAALKIYDAFGMHPDMFSIVSSKFDNKAIAERQTYENTIIPDANEWSGGLNQKLMTDDKRNRIVVDYSHLNCFQQELKEKAEGIKAMVEVLTSIKADSQITDQEYREQLFELGIGDGKPVPQQAEQTPPPTPEEIKQTAKEKLLLKHLTL